MNATDYYFLKKKRMKKIIFGVFILSAGFLLLLFNTGVLPHEYKHIVFSWQMLLISIGVINIISKDNWLIGAILISVGSFFILPKLHEFTFEFSKLFWPVILIAAGLIVIIKKGFKKTPGNTCKGETINLESGYINDSNIFSGSKHKFSAVEFKGGKISNIFGGSEVDLTQATLADGKNTLEVNAIFGGVKIIVPSDWTIHLDVSTIMGGFEDKRNIRQGSNTEKELFIKGSAIFGGGELRSY